MAAYREINVKRMSWNGYLFITINELLNINRARVRRAGVAKNLPILHKTWCNNASARLEQVMRLGV